MAKYLGFLRKMISSKEDNHASPTYAREQCFKVLTSFMEYDSEEFERMQQYSREIIKDSPGNYLRMSLFAKGLVFTTLLHLLLTLDREELFHHFLRYYLSMDPAGKFRLTKQQWEHSLNALTRSGGIEKSKMLKAVAHMGGKSLKALDFLKSRDQDGLMDSELSERVFQSLAMEESQGDTPIVDWRKYLPYVFAFFCQGEAQEMFNRYQQIHEIIGLPRELQSTGSYEVKADGEVTGLLSRFLPYIPIDSTKITLEPEALLDYELSISFLSHRCISEALKAFQVSSSLNISTADIAAICEQIRTDFPATSLVWDDINVNLRTILPHLAMQLCAASELKTLASKGHTAKEVVAYAKLAVRTAINLDKLTYEELGSALTEEMGDADSTPITGEETADLLAKTISRFLPKQRSVVLHNLQDKVVEALSSPQPRSQATAEAALAAMRESLAEELDDLFAFFVEKFETRQTVHQHLRGRPDTTGLRDTGDSGLHARTLSDALSNPMLKETRYKQIVVQIARAVILT